MSRRSRGLEWLGRRIAAGLERANVIERSRLRATVDLAWPRVVTGFSRMSQQTADLAMVGLVLGSPAIAGLAFAYAYWQVGNRVSLGISGGSISLVSQHFGGDDVAMADRAIVQSFLLATVVSIPLVGLFHWGAEPLIALFSPEPDALAFGATYLAVLAPAIVFEFYNKVASRIFAGVGDTFTPMMIRAGGAALNIVLNAIFIFGLGMGVVGAAAGTVIATVLVTIAFAWGLFGGAYPNRAPLPVGLRLAGPAVDPTVLRPLVVVSTPLIFQQLARAVVVFPLLTIAAVFGSTAVAAFEIARRIRDLINSLSWGYSIASSSLVGRHLGADEEGVATAYGDEILKLAVVSYVAVAAVIFAFADPVSRLFVTDPDAIELTTLFVRVAVIASIGLGLDGVATGALRGAGDTRWPFYGALVGLYVFTLPVAYLGVVTPLGIRALYAALLVETFVPAAVTIYRYRTGAWRAVSRSLRAASSGTGASPDRE